MERSFTITTVSSESLMDKPFCVDLSDRPSKSVEMPYTNRFTNIFWQVDWLSRDNLFLEEKEKCLMNQCFIIVQQMTRRIIITIFAFWTAQTLTDLTTNNCPHNFDPNNYNYTLNHDNAAMAASLYGSVLSSEVQANITASLSQGQLYTIINNFSSSSFLLPYILIASFFVLFFFTLICCCSFQRRCPPCKSWRRNYVKDPYTPCQNRTAMIFGIIFATGTLIATIIVFSSFKSLKSDIQMVQCSLYYTLDISTNGQQTKNWGGFAKVQQKLSGISTRIDETATEINTSLMGNEWIIYGFESIENMNLDLYQNNKNSVVKTPNPTTTYTANSNSLPIPTVMTRFIAQGLGPNGTANTMVTDISSGFQVTKQVFMVVFQLTDQADKTYKSAKMFSSSASNIVLNTNNNLESITVASSLLTKINVSLDFFKNQYLRYATDYGIYIMEAVFGLILLASLMSVLGVISTHLFDLFKCTKMVNAGWILLGLGYLCVLAVLIVMLVIGSTSHTFCQYFQGIITSDKSFASFSTQPNANDINKLFNYLDVCFFGDGNILKKFSVSSQMNTVSSLFENTQTLLNMQTSGNTEYIDLTVSTSKILGWMNAMNQYAFGVYYDANPSDPSEDNPYVAIAHMNLLTLMYNTTSPNNVCANDLWVFDSTNCSKTAQESLYAPSADTSNGLYFPPTGSICISLNTRIANSAPSIWTAADIAQRYLSKRSCNLPNSEQAYNDIIKYAESLANYRDTRKNQYQSLYDQLNSLLVQTSTYNTNMTNFVSSLNTFFSTVSILNNLVTNQIDGLTISANCTTIADSFRFFYNMYCVNFINRSVKIVVSCIVLLVLIVGALLAGCIFGVRYERIEKEQKLVQKDMQSQVFQEQESEVTNSESDSDGDNN